MGLVVVAEEDARTLLIHRISHEDIYNRQGEETIIMWSDPDVGTDVALSFQEAAGCNSIWEQIQHYRHDTHPRSPESIGSVGPAMRRHGMVDELEEVGAAVEEEEDAATVESRRLPSPEIGNLPHIAKALSEVMPFQREALAKQLTPPVIERLLDIYRQLDDLEDAQGLARMFEIVRGIIMLADANLVELLLDERYVMDVMGALECDPECTERQRHRQFLQQHAMFKEVVPIVDLEVRRKIHQTYRMGYIKDVVLPRVLDDSTFATLSSLMLFNSVEILLGLMRDPNFLPDLFERLKTASMEDPSWGDLVHFLQELCSNTKHLQSVHRSELLQRMAQLGLYQVLTKVIQWGDDRVKLRAMDVLVSALQHNPQPLRVFILKQQEHGLFVELIKCLRHGAHGGLQEQVGEVLRLLLDPETSEQTGEQSEFLEMFYASYIQEVIALLGGDVRKPAPSRAASQAAAGARQPRSALGKRKESPNGGLDAAGSLASGLPSPAAHAGQAGAAERVPDTPGSTAPSSTSPPAQAQGGGQAAPSAAAQRAQPAAAPAASPPHRSAAGPDAPGPQPHAPAPAAQAAEGRAGSEESSAGRSGASPSTLALIVELLCFCVQHHSFRIKYYILRNQVVEAVLQLLKRREKHLVLAAVRFVRTCLSLKDEFYNRYLIKANLLEPIFAVFVANGTRYNMLHSSVLEMLDFIRKESVKSLLEHIVESHMDTLRELPIASVLDAVQLRHEQLLEQPPSSQAPAAALPARRRPDARALDREEEDYFNEDDEDPNGSTMTFSQELPISLPPARPMPLPLRNSPARQSNAVRRSSPTLLINTHHVGTGSGGGAAALVDYGSDEDEETNM